MRISDWSSDVCASDLATISIRAMFTSRARATKSSLAFAAPHSIAEACATMAKAGGTAGAERGGHGKVELCRPAAQFDHTDAHSFGRGRHPFFVVERRTRPIWFAGTRCQTPHYSDGGWHARCVFGAFFLLSTFLNHGH